MILPSVVRSGRTPKRAWAPPGATRNEMTSSKMRTMPSRSVTSLRRSRKPGWGSSMPALARSGSTMSPAMSLPCFSRILTHASASFHGSTMVCLRTVSGTPDE